MLKINLCVFGHLFHKCIQLQFYFKIGQDVKPPGHPVGLGLTARAAEELDLLEGIPVGTSIIDAHAGGLGMLGCSAPNVSSEFTSRLGI